MVGDIPESWGFCTLKIEEHKQLQIPSRSDKTVIFQAACYKDLFSTSPELKTWRAMAEQTKGLL